MSSPTDFIIENSVLIRYTGSGGKVKIPAGVTAVGKQAFLMCGKLTDVELPEGLLHIEDGAFQHCWRLRRVRLPKSLTSIGEQAFFCCFALERIDLPEGLASIGDGAFENCRSLKRIDLPERLTQIGSMAFSGCAGLADSDGCVIVRGVLRAWYGTGPDAVIPEGVTVIGAHSFQSSTRLTRVTLPRTVTSIEACAFFSCGSLERIDLPEGLESIGESAFYHCESLKQIDLPDSLQSIGDKAFEGCESLKQITLPDSLQSIGDKAFEGCESLERIDLPDSVRSIGSCAFRDCRSLSELRLGDGPVSIGRNAFTGCKSLLDRDGFVIVRGVLYAYCGTDSDVRIPEGVTAIEEEAFSSYLVLRRLRLPEGLVSIGSKAFADCAGLGRFELPQSVERIGSGAFRGCSRLADSGGFVILRGVLHSYEGPGGEVTVPDGVTEIGEKAFSENDAEPEWEAAAEDVGLTGVTLPEGVRSIGSSAFASCKNLRNISLPESLTSIGDYAFKGCESLERVRVPDGVTSIGSGVFRECGRLRRVVLPVNLKYIGSEAFAYCLSLPAVRIPNGVKGIGGRAFFGCTMLDDVRLPAGLTEIGQEAFGECKSLTGIALPDGLQSLGRNAFRMCVSLEWVRSPIPLNRFYTWDRSLVLLMRGEKTALLAYDAKVSRKDRKIIRNKEDDFDVKSYRDNVSDFAHAGAWNRYDLELLNNGPVYRFSMQTRLAGALGRLKDPAELSEEARTQYADLLNRNGRQLVGFAEACGETGIIRDLLSLNELTEKMRKSIRARLRKSAVPELAALADKTITPAEPAPAPARTGLERLYAEKLEALSPDDFFRKGKLIGLHLPDVRLRDGTPAPQSLLRFLLAACGMRKEDGYRPDPEADEAAALLAYDSFIGALDQIPDQLPGDEYPGVLPLLCRYGNAKQIRALTSAWRRWHVWARYNRKGRKAQDVLTEALALSDTREAFTWLYRNGRLERYARLRGRTAAEAGDQENINYGFDKTGRRVFDLGTVRIAAELTPDGKLTLRNAETGKPVRVIPKRGIDPEARKQVEDETDDMRASLGWMGGIRTELLLRRFVGGETLSAARWRQTYPADLFLRRLCEPIIWTQGGRNFALSADGLVDSAGQLYALTDEPVGVAHPMEMAAAETEAWGRFLADRGLEQPFPQIREPVRKPPEVRPDRYAGIRIPIDSLRKQEARGIRVGTAGALLRIEGFEVEAERAGSRPEDYKLLLIKSLKPLGWNRRTSAVVAFLDRLTVDGRVRRDDVTVMDLVPEYSRARILELMEEARQANAASLLASLLEYKNKRFPDEDPIGDLSLD